MRSASHPTTCRSSTRTATRRPRAVLDAAGRVTNVEECVGEIVNTQGIGSLRGLLQQPRSDRDDDPLRLVLVGRPRLQGRRRIPVLRRSQRGLDPRRRRELPCRTDRGGVAARARGRARRGLRRPRRPGGRPGDGRCRPRRRRRLRRRRVRGVARRAGRDRTEVAAALPARAARPADDRYEQDRQAHPRAGQVPPRSRRRRPLVRTAAR